MKTSKIIIISLLMSLNLWAHNALAASSVWKVSKGQEYFYVGGTVHLLTAADHPLPKEFYRAYRDTDKLVMETDIAATQQLAFQAQLMMAMSYTDERVLASELSPEVYARLTDFMAARKLPLAGFAKFRPWGLSLAITMLEYQRLGMVPNQGVDFSFSSLARADHKTMTSLETPQQQLQALSSMDKIDPNTMIDYTLRDLKSLPEFIQQMKSSWRSGDLEALASNHVVTQMKNEFPEIYRALITERNNAWMRQIPTLLSDGKRPLILVGALHLVGQEGLLKQLQAQGFQVEQL
ncbi:hypothetical protein EDC56_2506 [Sinobacterium caligoides]|uniref:TraB family protein n=1 Tax=Sinobacterium caligoides TaxID=933926 RepID=A0A3N2DQF4_9GAMM|nr:TraB/GumN family protein [Sinobacterium caligoides]ROS02056.1 hypothetical protein EDC56_2506 [Sinobacterium caligoides]